jgi:hypothetical protein
MPLARITPFAASRCHAEAAGPRDLLLVFAVCRGEPLSHSAKAMFELLLPAAQT